MDREERAPRILIKMRWLMDFSFKAFGERPVGQITAPEILAVLRKIEAAF
jgi:hypothetical protein